MDDSSPVSAQIDTLSELHAKIVEGGLAVSDQLHALVVLGALPPSYETVQSSIIGSYADLTTIAFNDIRARILAEELRQSSSGSINAIHCPSQNKSTNNKGKSKCDKSKDKCLWCGKTGHWADDCMAKKAGLSKEEARDDKKRRTAVKEYAAKNKGKVQEANISAIIETTNIADEPNVVDTPTNEEAQTSFLFYIARTTEWMIDSGATEHITPYATDFTTYLPLGSNSIGHAREPTNKMPHSRKRPSHGHYYSRREASRNPSPKRPTRPWNRKAVHFDSAPGSKRILNHAQRRESCHKEHRIRPNLRYQTPTHRTR